MFYDMRQNLSPSRCTIAMWDFSWLFCHPYWDNWKNVVWYQKVNHKFLKNSQAK